MRNGSRDSILRAMLRTLSAIEQHLRPGLVRGLDQCRDIGPRPGDIRGGGEDDEARAVAQPSRHGRGIAKLVQRKKVENHPAVALQMPQRAQDRVVFQDGVNATNRSAIEGSAGPSTALHRSAGNLPGPSASPPSSAESAHRPNNRQVQRMGRPGGQHHAAGVAHPEKRSQGLSASPQRVRSAPAPRPASTGGASRVSRTRRTTSGGLGQLVAAWFR
jgi:hypothetical protein